MQDYGWPPAKVDRPEQADPSSPKPHKCDEPRAVVIRLYQDPNTRFGENDALPSDITNTVCWKSVCQYDMFRMHPRVTKVTLSGSLAMHVIDANL